MYKYAFIFDFGETMLPADLGRRYVIYEKQYFKRLGMSRSSAAIQPV
jgi:hypothetical protein